MGECCSSPRPGPWAAEARRTSGLRKKKDWKRRGCADALLQAAPFPRQQVLVIPRKEVIQPQVPLRLPCYDFAPVTEFAFGRSLPRVGSATSGTPGFRGLTGGVYKAQEHIHRGVADPRLLAIPPSCRRIAACNPNWGEVFGISLPSPVCGPLSSPL